MNEKQGFVLIICLSVVMALILITLIVSIGVENNRECPSIVEDSDMQCAFCSPIGCVVLDCDYLASQFDPDFHPNPYKTGEQQ